MYKDTSLYDLQNTEVKDPFTACDVLPAENEIDIADSLRALGVDCDSKWFSSEARKTSHISRRIIIRENAGFGEIQRMTPRQLQTRIRVSYPTALRMWTIIMRNIRMKYSSANGKASYTSLFHIYSNKLSMDV